jgi:DNA mismatch endonuclease, patch repair protein
MADVFSSYDRSRVMARIRSKRNLTTEMRLVTALKALKITGWRRHLPLFGRPDFAFPRQHVVVFVDGCFWHGCSKHGRKPTSNTNYWLPKLVRNRKRDAAVSRHYRNQGWAVLRFWEHDAEKAPERCAEKIRQELARRDEANKV